MHIKLGIQGERGSFSHLAATKLLGEAGVEFEIFSCKTFAELTQGVANGDFDLALMPIENSIAGSILGNYDLLTKHDLSVIAETYLRIQHCLIGLPGKEVNEIKAVYSHEMAIKQCQKFLQEYQIEPREYYDTAGAAKDLKAMNVDSFAAIASKLAAEEYGLEVIVEGIETDKSNYTRFVLLSNQQGISRYTELVKAIENNANNSQEHKLLLEFQTEHKPGALMQALKILANADFNLTKIESRPVIGESWNYRFYVDFITEKDNGVLEQILGELKSKTVHFKLLGKIAQGKSYQP